MNAKELQDLVERVSAQDFGRPFTDQAVFNGRLRTTGGRFFPGDMHLEFNTRMFAVVDHATQVGIIRHELTHYHLYRAHRGYKHRDRDFRRLLQQVDGLRYAPALTSGRPQSTLLYRCTRCGAEYPRRRHINTKRYVCSRCHGRLVLVNKPG
ncbi:SprT family protein [Lacticaseibacillus thailandensis]|uniref:SprT family peptidase n=1 Tax=Lacticaseibacillus thailandensis DSM 22698 = JCM 13996 TaxID=1423810 RepID=A0A0R2C8Z6_9LACO|nr:SprT family protein [Lacticaseibacillus thailandensis]KRM87824.1 SprT family peptidase [Lacticaseibacillus thailandensis DSM 22698 = JCM 13996]